MSNVVKNVIGIMLAIGIPLYVAATLWSSYYDRANDPAAFRDFTVSAEGRSEVKPDIATLHLSVLTEGGTNVQDLQKSNSEKMNKVIAFVKSKEVKDEDITTSNYSISPRYQYFDCSVPTPMMRATPPSEPSAAPTEEMRAEAEVKSDTKVCPPPQIVGYSVSQTATVKVRKFESIGDILAGATSQGANSVSGPNFEIDDPSVYQKAAREQAITRAREKAQEMARLGGFTLGRVISIDENSYTPGYFDGYGKGGSLEADRVAAAPDIQPGSQRMTVEVRLRYEIK